MIGLLIRPETPHGNSGSGNNIPKKTEDKRIVALFLGDYLVSEGGLEPPRPNRAQGP